MATRTETDVLKEILPTPLQDQIPNIIKGSTKLALLMQSTHLDYDWLGTFWQYLRYGFAGNYPGGIDGDRAIQTVLDNAATLVSETKPATQFNYTFSIAEMRFLQEAIAHKPDLLDAFQKAGVRFDILGATVETPDGIVPPGEATGTGSTSPDPILKRRSGVPSQRKAVSLTPTLSLLSGL